MEDSSIGIIGGQDGPTAILVSGDPTGLVLLLLLVAAVAGAALWLSLRKRKK